jgi:hypothetical protein
MADTPQKIDPIGERYFRPVALGDAAADTLFYISAALSLLVPLIEQQTYPKLYAIAQTAFALSVIALFAFSQCVCTFRLALSSGAIKTSLRTRSASRFRPNKPVGITTTPPRPFLVGLRRKCSKTASIATTL